MSRGHGSGGVPRLVRPRWCADDRARAESDTNELTGAQGIAANPGAQPAPVAPVPAAQPMPIASACGPSYPDACIPPTPPDLDRGDAAARRFAVLPPDRHGFDGDFDGVGCERG